jgi:peptide/nickel transport system substrate-binding protein
MASRQVSDLIEDLSLRVRSGEMTRRQVLQRAIALGLSAPVIAGLLAACGGDSKDETPTTAAAANTPAATQPASGASSPSSGASEPTKPAASAEASPSAKSSPSAEATKAETGQAGGGGTLRILQWQAPTMLNPHLATGYKDYDASRVAYEPLADFNTNGEGVPILAAEFPTIDNGGVTADGLTVTWTLRKDVTWQDGEPFTSKDVKFTWEYATDPDTAAVTSGVFKSIASVDTPDDYTVKLTFKQPNPAGFEIFAGRNGMIIPEHIFRETMGADSRNAPANLTPVGTGPYKVTEFRPGDVVLFDRYDGYWDKGKPYFDKVELKGGGDALSATRAVLQTGEADWAWGAGGDAKVVAELEKTGTTGTLTRRDAIAGDRVAIQLADPNTEVDGARAEPGTQHPVFQHKEGRQSIALSIPRDVLANEVYGLGAKPASNNLLAPARFVSPNTSWTFDLDQAKALVDQLGVSGTKLLFQTSITSTRQKAQEVIKQGLQQIGYEVELKTVDAAVFFSADAGNPDTYTKFYADLEIFTYAPDSLYPINYMDRYATSGIAQKSNSWNGRNVTRYSNPEYDKLHEQAQSEMDPDTQNELFIKMNDMSVDDVVEIPLVVPQGLTAASKDLTGYDPTSWTGPYWDIANWRKG